MPDGRSETLSGAPDEIEGVETRGGSPIVGFDDAAAFDAGSSTASRTSAGIWAKLAEKGAAMAGPSRTEAVDSALCHGWIDGQQDRYEADRRLVRFTPRRRASRWSQVNRARALESIEAGHMRPAASGEIDAARRDGRWDAAYAPASKATVPPDLAAALDASPTAAAFFATLKRSNRYAVLYRLEALRQPEARVRRIAEVVALFKKGQAVRHIQILHLCPFM